MARILLVDDEKVARAMYGDYLIAAEHVVTAVGSLAEARAALEAERFDAVVTDLILPEGDGMDLLRFTKERYPDAEVILITALDKVDPAVRAIKSGAAEYLVKPVAPEALTYAVSRALSTRRILRENEHLRAHVALLETGQRIATTLDRERLMATALSAFAQSTRASAVLIYAVQGGGELRLEGAHGLSEPEREQLGAALVTKVQESLSSATERPRVVELDLQGLPGGYLQGYAVAATDSARPFGCVALLFREASVPEHLSTAGYYAQHLGVALRNAGRFAEVEDLAYLDDLTHLFNVRYLDLVLERELRLAASAQKPLSLLFLDLDYFKSVNDTHGHLVGSKLLVEVAKLVSGCVRDDDVVCRYGGDEYVVLLRATDSGGALKVGERIRRTIETHHFLAREGYGLSLTTCIGVASYPEHATDKAALIDFADRAMYRGKKGTRNVIYVAAKGLEATPAQRHQRGDGSAGTGR